MELLANATRREAFGAAAREQVRKEYLLPRLLRDELRFIKSVLDGSASPPHAVVRS